MSQRWEHALVAETIAKATGACPECTLGRTAVQKLLYFMNVLGVPMQYQFEIYHYGPYCGLIANDLEWLLADEAVKNESGAGYNYRPGPQYDAYAKSFEGRLREFAPQIDLVAKTFGHLPPTTLELIATLDFSYRWVKASGSGEDLKVATIEKFRRIKGEKFTASDIETWFNKLIELGLIQCDAIRAGTADS